MQARVAHGSDTGAVHLARGRDALGGEAERLQHAAPVLGDGLSEVIGAAAEVQFVVRREADTPTPSGHGDDAVGWNMLRAP